MKIAVCGSAPSSRMLAPFNNPEFEIWACSPQNYDFPRVDAWFELHDLSRKFVPENYLYTSLLQRHPRVYVAKADTRLPNAIIFNPQPLLDKYGDDFFTSSLAWMLAFAIEQKPEEISIFGVDLSATDEYDYQRPGFKFFMREAKNAGIRLSIPVQSDLHEPLPLYGFQEHWPMFQKIKASTRELENRIDRLQREIETKRDLMIGLKGAREYTQYIKNTYISGAPFWLDKKPDETI